jgi:autotransporter-associated beta strand protein
MEINAGSLVIANAGLLTRGALTVSGTGAVLDLGATEQSVSAFRLAAGTVLSGSLTASSFGLESGLVSAVLGGTATLTKNTGGTVVLSGANDLSGLMEINGGSLVIANAGLLDAWRVDGGRNWGGAGSGSDGSERVCVPVGSGHSAEREFDGEQLWVGVWFGECGAGRYSDADQEHWRHCGVEWGE